VSTAVKVVSATLYDRLYIAYWSLLRQGVEVVAESFKRWREGTGY
jgi:hypothetical protein